jgi:hypothetical protein
MENVLSLSCIMLKKGIIWLNALYVKKKSVNQKRHGRWLEGKIRKAREQNLQLDYLSIAENLSGLS